MNRFSFARLFAMLIKESLQMRRDRATVALTVMLPMVQLFLFGMAFPLGWLQAPTYDHLMALVRMPLVRIYLFILCSLPLFHWAHRFRYTLYDGLKVKHLTGLIFVLCYGGAALGTAIAAYLLWTIA